MPVQQGKRMARTRTPSEKEKAEKTAGRLNRLLKQLIASAAIFLLVFVGGGLIPTRVCDVMGSVHRLVTEETSVLESVQALGTSVSEGTAWPQAVKDWCVDTFLPGHVQEASTVGESTMSAGLVFRAHLMPAALNSNMNLPDGTQR